MMRRSDFHYEDLALGNLLRRNDPAGEVTARDCGRLEMLIAARASATPQHGGNVARPWFPAFPVLNIQVPWPVIGAGAMMLGLLVGFSASIVNEAPVNNYSVASAMSEPWHSFVQ
jgi:hypothetical protein